jgi:hypothetical protein
MKRRHLCTVSIISMCMLALGLVFGRQEQTAYAAGKTYYVALLGSDNNPGTEARPFRTIQKCATTASAGDTCTIRAGIYTETVTPRSGVTLQAFGQEPVVISGADLVRGWTRHSGNIYKASVTLNPQLLANQVFINDRMAMEARWPNTGSDPMKPAWATAQAGSTATTILDPRIPNIDWTGATVHIWGGTNPFAHTSSQVSSSAAGRVEFPRPRSCDGMCSAPDARYYLVGKLAALDSANEWYYDAQSKTLYLWAPGNVNPDTLLVSAKQRDWAFDLRGKSNVTIRGVSLFGSGIITDNASQQHMIDGIRARYLSHFERLDGPITWKTNNRTTGIVLNGSGHVIKNSHIQYSAGSGIVLGGSGNTATNNLIHDIGYAGAYGTPILLPPNTANHTVTYNTIYNAARDGINLDYDDQRDNETAAGHDIGYNVIYDYALLTADAGGIDTCCFQNENVTAPVTKIHHNHVYNSRVRPDLFQTGGIYLDNSPSGFEVYQNVVWDNLGYGIYLHGTDGFVKSNRVYNNTVLGAHDSSILFDKGLDATGTVIENNVILSPVKIENGGSPGGEVRNNNKRVVGANEGYTATVGCNLLDCQSSAPPARPPAERPASEQIDAVDFDQTNGDVTTFGGVLGGLVNGRTVTYLQIDFGNGGLKTFEASLGAGACCGGRAIELRLGSASGTLIGTLRTEATSSSEFNFSNRTIQATAVSNVTGVQNLVLVCGKGDGCGDIDYFRFTTADPPAPFAYDATKRIEAESYDEASGSVSNDGLSVSGLGDGDSLTFKNVDFGSGNGVNQFNAQVATPGASGTAQIQIRLDSATGPLIGTLNVAPNNGSANTQSTSVALNGARITGKRDLVLSFTGEVGTLDWVRFADTTPPPVKRQATDQIEAESFDGSTGQVRNEGTYIGNLFEGDTITYEGVDFGTGGLTTFRTKIATGTCCGGKQFDLRLDSADGPLIGTFTVTATGSGEYDFSVFTEQTTTISGTSGVHDLVLVVKGTGVGNIDWFTFE